MGLHLLPSLVAMAKSVAAQGGQVPALVVQALALGSSTATGYVTSGRRLCLREPQDLISWHISGYRLLASDKTHFYS